MNKTFYWLGGLLGLQLLLALGLLWYGGTDRTANRVALFDFAVDSIDGVKIGDGEHEAVLAKKDGRWQLPELEQLPATASKVTDVLNKLAGFKPVWPVTATAASHNRFEVAEDKFQRRIRLYQGETLKAEIYLGTSPGFRKSHVRKAGDDAVYSIALNGFEVPAENSGWLDKSLLAATGVNAIEGSDYALEKADGNWRFAGAGEAEGTQQALDTGKAGQLASALGGLTVLGIADKAPEGEPITLKVTTPDGTRSYSFFETDDKYFVGRDDRKIVFSLSQFDYDRIAKVDKAKLLQDGKESDAAEEGAEPVDQPNGESEEPVNQSHVEIGGSA
ncbi:MAG: DUF4340 domain-containing protein [Gammaproteobacteria bacterium]